jgi:hypothetical protein
VSPLAAPIDLFTSRCGAAKPFYVTIATRHSYFSRFAIVT